MTNILSGLFTERIAIDLGTANTLIYRSKGGSSDSSIVLNEPSVASFTYHKGHLVPYGFGKQAKSMVGRTPTDVRVVRPLKDGVIADFHGAEEMIKYFIRSVARKKMPFVRLFVIVCVPQESTPVERRAIQQAVESSGGDEVYLIEEPMAAAIGSGLPVLEPFGSMVVDIGGGTTEVGVLSLGGVVVAKSIRVAGDAMDQAIISYIRSKHSLLIGEATAESIKRQLSLADESDSELISIKGRNSVTGVPKEITIKREELLNSLDDVLSVIIDAILKTLEICPPELSGDIMTSGVMLTGGGALIPGIADKIRTATGLDAKIADDPLYCVVRGTGIALENLEQFKHVLFRQD